jgi:hypothetical protein
VLSVNNCNIKGKKFATFLYILGNGGWGIGQGFANLKVGAWGMGNGELGRGGEKFYFIVLCYLTL